MKRERILIVEDEPDIAEVLRYNLDREGFEVSLETQGDIGLERIQQVVPDLVVLDLMLPGLDGLEVMRRIKLDGATRNIPVIMLTARSEEVDRIVGLELGADDYITKPFSPREVVLRCKAVLRRKGAEEEPEETEVLTVGGLSLDLPAHALRVNSTEVPLTSTEFRLLRHLMERVGRVQSREQLLTAVWGYDKEVDSRTVDTHIRRLRRKLGDAADLIETLIGVGYRLRA